MSNRKFADSRIFAVNEFVVEMTGALENVLDNGQELTADFSLFEEWLSSKVKWTFLEQLYFDKLGREPQMIELQWKFAEMYREPGDEIFIEPWFFPSDDGRLNKYRYNPLKGQE